MISKFISLILLGISLSGCMSLGTLFHQAVPKEIVYTLPPLPDPHLMDPPAAMKEILPYHSMLGIVPGTITVLGTPPAKKFKK